MFLQILDLPINRLKVDPGEKKMILGVENFVVNYTGGAGDSAKELIGTSGLSPDRAQTPMLGVRQGRKRL